MSVVWSKASEEVIQLTKMVIEQHHPRLRTARIGVIMRSEAPSVNGMVTMGKCKKISPELQLHIPYQFIIWLAEDEWERLSAWQQEALIDHQLSHCGWDGSTASILGHDIEEFNHIIRRRGFWWPTSDRTAIAVQAALPLPPTEPPRQGSVGTIDFGRIAKEVGEQMRADGFDVEVGQVPATNRGE